MFDHYYGFTRLPFTKDIPPDQLFQADGQSELCARLDYLLKDRGLGLVTGETGSGKSTTLRRFTAHSTPTAISSSTWPIPSSACPASTAIC